MLLAFLMMFAEPFWEAVPAPEWTYQQMRQLMMDSPWAYSSEGIRVYIATATPVREAEKRLAASRGTPAGETPGETNDYEEFMRQNPGKYIVVAVAVGGDTYFDKKELKRMEDNSVLRSGKQKLAMVGHFLPVAEDPYLRLVFPREIDESARKVTLDFYVPSRKKPLRYFEWEMKDLVYKGRPDY